MTSRNRGGLFLLALTASGILFSFATPVAQAVENETFGLLPRPHNVANTERRTFGIPLEPGAVFEDAVRVYNRTEQPLDLILYAADAETGVDGTISVGFRGSRPKGVGAWVHLSRDSLTLPPRGEAVVSFRVDVASSDPTPDLGAIVVENAERGIAADLAERLHIVVRTSSPNSATTSVRVRPLLLRSPWIILATIGLLVALLIVWLGARRARHPRDALVPSGGLREAPPEEVTQAASKPILRRLGESQSTGRRRLARPRLTVSDERPILDELLAEVDEPALERPRPAKRRPARTAAASKTPPKSRSRRKEAQPHRDDAYIPLDKL